MIRLTDSSLGTVEGWTEVHIIPCLSSLLVLMILMRKFSSSFNLSRNHEGLRLNRDIEVTTLYHVIWQCNDKRCSRQYT